MTETRTTCPYCGVGCGVIVASEGGQITGVRGDPDHPANRGRLCTKGSTLHLTAAPHLQAQVRALQPMRRATRGGPLEPVSWDAALDEVADRLAAVVRAQGPEAVGVYLSGQLLTEDYYVFHKLARGLIGTPHIDSNSRLCMSSAVAAYKASLGADAPPACYDDLGLAQTVFVTGSNMAWAHPVLFRRLEDARRACPAQRLIVVDPRRTETAEVADLHLQLQPGTDVMLHHAMLHLMLWEGLADPAFIEAHTRGFAALRDRVRDCSPAVAARFCGLKEDDIVQAARWFAGLDGPDDGPAGDAAAAIAGSGGAGQRRGALRAPTLSLYCQGLNQSSHGTDNNRSLINLHLATGQIGRPGAGPLSLTGQPNAMGGREVGAMATLLSGHRDLADPRHRAEVAALWGVPEIPAQPGRAAVQMFEAAADGAIRALWIVCTNPLHSLPDTAQVRRALERAEFVIVQDAYRTPATVDAADLLLPAASWGEKDGTVTNSERCISRVRAAVPPPGQARADWRIAADVAQRLGPRLPSRPSTHGFAYADAASVWLEHRETTRGRDLDITGLSLDRLDQEPQPWPCPSGADRGRQRLYEDHRFPTADGRAVFAAMPVALPAEPRDARFPLALNTGRLRDQWHGMSRTGTLGRLFAHEPEPAIELHPQELERRRLRPGDLVQVISRRGRALWPVKANEAVAPLQAFLPMHWGPEFVSGDGVNGSTVAACCPHSAQPALKLAAVRLEAVTLPWHLVAAAWLPAEQAVQALHSLRRGFPSFTWASVGLFGRESAGPGAPARVGVLVRAALDAVPAGNPVHPGLEAIVQTLGLQNPTVLRYADARAGQHRALRRFDDGSLEAFLLAGRTAAAAWALELLQQGLPAEAIGAALLSDSPRVPGATPTRSPQVCSCLDVREDRIWQALRSLEGDAPTRLQALQGQLKCGTQCGSCLPRLKVLVRDGPRP